MAPTNALGCVGTRTVSPGAILLPACAVVVFGLYGREAAEALIVVSDTLIT